MNMYVVRHVPYAPRFRFRKEDLGSAGLRGLSAQQ